MRHRRKRQRLIVIAAAALAAVGLALLIFGRTLFGGGDAAATPTPALTPALTAASGGWTSPAQTETPTPTDTPVPTETLATPIETPAATHTPVLSALERDVYDISLTVHAEVMMPYVDGAMRLTYVNRSEDTLYEIKLHLYPNDINPGFMSVSDVAVNDALVYYALEGENKGILSVSLPMEIYPGEQAEIFLNFHIDIPESADRYGRSNMGIRLGNALPIAAMYENGAWRTDAYCDEGDAFYSRCSDYRVSVSAPAGWELAHTGSLNEKTAADGFTTWYTSARAAREFAIVLMNKPGIASAQADGGRIKVYAYGLNTPRAKFAADTAAAALDYFCERIGDYPYDIFYVVPFGVDGGMEYPGLVMINERTLRADSPDDGALIIGHEVAHQWFYAVVGSDQINSPWLDEGLAEYLGVGFVESYLGETRAQKLSSSRYAGLEVFERRLRMDADLYTLAQEPSAYFYTVYAAGYALYSELEAKIGEAAFNEGLRTYFNACGFRFGDKVTLISAFSEASDTELWEWFEERLAAKTTDG